MWRGVAQDDDRGHLLCLELDHCSIRLGRRAARTRQEDRMTEHHKPSGQVGCIDGRVLDVSWHADEVLLAFGDTEIRLSAEGAARLANLLTADRSEPPAPIPTAQASHQDPAVTDAQARSPRQTPTEATKSRLEATPEVVEARPGENAPDPEAVLDERSTWAHDETDTAGDAAPPSLRKPTGEDRNHYKIDGRPVRVRDLLDTGLLAEGDLLTWQRPRMGELHSARVLETGQIQLDDGSERKFDTPSPAAMEASGTRSQPGRNVWCVADGRTLLDLRKELIERERHGSNQ